MYTVFVVSIKNIKLYKNFKTTNYRVVKKKDTFVYTYIPLWFQIFDDS